jgi:hypothetical protein
MLTVGVDSATATREAAVWQERRVRADGGRVGQLARRRGRAAGVHSRLRRRCRAGGARTRADGRLRAGVCAVGIAAFLRWLEELVVLVSGSLLMAGLGIGLVALLSDGALLVTAPWLVYAWAISQTVGVDGQLVGTWYRVSVAVGGRRIGVAIAYLLLGLLLAYVAYVAALVFATQQAYHLTTGQALSRLGMDATSWLWQRSAVSVLLVCLSGYLRYRAPRKPARSLDEQKRAIQEQMELDALKRARRAQQAQGAVGLLKEMAQVARGEARGEQPSRDVEEVSAAPAVPLSTRGSALPMA